MNTEHIQRWKTHYDDGGFLLKMADMTRSILGAMIKPNIPFWKAALPLCFFLAICSLKVDAAGIRSDTLIHGFRCELADVFWFPQELANGMTADVVIKKILNDGSLADYAPMQHFILQIDDTCKQTFFLLPDKTQGAEAVNVSLPLNFQVGSDTRQFFIAAWAILPDVPAPQYDHLPLTIPAPELEGKIWQSIGYNKLNLGLFDDSRAAFQHSIRTDSSNCASYFYDMGCTYARQGKPSEALKWIHLAVDSGYDSYIHALSRDTDLESLRALPEFRSIITAPLVHERAKLFADLAVRPERASDDYFEIAHSYLKQGDIDSFYVSLEAGLKRGLIPKFDDLTEEEEFAKVQQQGAMDSLVRKYVSPVFLTRSNGTLTKRLQPNEKPVLHPTSIAQRPSPSPFEPVILLQVGDTISGLNFYALDWNTKLLRTIGAMTFAEARFAREIQANGSGVIAFTQGDPSVNERLCVRKRDSTLILDAPFRYAYLDGRGINEDRHFPSFSLSPDGADIVTATSRDLFAVDSSMGTLFTQTLISRLASGKNYFEPPRVDTFATTGFHADARFERILVGWDAHDSGAVLLQDLYPGQLESKILHLWKYYPQIHTYVLASSDVQDYFSTSLNGTYILFTNNDETCCAGINYSDNQIILQNVETHVNTTVYDEWNRFGSMDKQEEHQPRKAEISPDGKWIAATIENLYDPTSHSPGSSSSSTGGAVTADFQLFIFGLNAEVRLVISHRQLVGWLDATHILVQQCLEDFQRTDWSNVRSELRVFDINDCSEHPLLTTDAKCLGIEWHASQKN